MLSHEPEHAVHVPQRPSVEKPLVCRSLVLVRRARGWRLPHRPPCTPHSPRKVDVLYVQRAVARIESAEFPPCNAAHKETGTECPIDLPVHGGRGKKVRGPCDAFLADDPPKWRAAQNRPAQTRKAARGWLWRTRWEAQQRYDYTCVLVLLHRTYHPGNAVGLENYIRIQNEAKIEVGCRKRVIVILCEPEWSRPLENSCVGKLRARHLIGVIIHAVDDHDYRQLPIELLSSERFETCADAVAFTR